RMVEARLAKALGQERELATPTKQIAAHERYETAGQETQLAVEEQVAIPRGDRAGRHEPIAQTKLAAESQGRRFVVQEAVRTDLNLKAVRALGPHRAAGTGALLEHGNPDARHGSLQLIGERQPGNAGTDDDDLAHVQAGASTGFVGGRGSGRAARP